MTFNMLCISFPDTMTFNLTGHNDSQLCCLVKVTPDPGLALSIFHDGVKAQSNESATGDRVAATPYVTLSETISLRGAREYECQLYLNKHLITKSVFHYHPTGNTIPPQPVLFSRIALTAPQLPTH